ncbi:hypothetical protein K3495_g11010 [Podosphaera aphanis]|nr:hypothetical protein K3495_g11010 [Podosphaera aphanis]
MAAHTFSHHDDPSIEEDLQRCMTSAIFIPFHGFPRGLPSRAGPAAPLGPTITSPLDPASKLEKILHHLPQQQDVVRAQMISLILQQAEARKAEARRAMERITEAAPQKKVDRDAQKRERSELDDMLQRMATPAQPGHVHELMPDTVFYSVNHAQSSPTRDADGDIDMGPAPTAPTTRKQVRRALAHDLQALVVQGVQKLEAYDVHCQAVRKPYASSMARKKAPQTTGPEPRRSDAVHGLPVKPSTRTVKFSSDGHGLPTKPVTRTVKFAPAPNVWATSDVGRLSNGMPVSLERLPARKIESLEELTRRSHN